MLTEMALACRKSCCSKSKKFTFEALIQYGGLREKLASWT